MCVCNPNIRTPYCGKVNCRPPVQSDMSLLMTWHRRTEAEGGIDKSDKGKMLLTEILRRMAGGWRTEK